MNPAPRLLALVLALAAVPSAADAAIITQFNFNTSLTTASTGTGTVNLLGTTGSSVSGNGSSDTGNPNNALNATSFPSQGTGSGTEGVGFAASTLGFAGPLTISFDLRLSNTASRYYQLQVSANGSTFANVSGGSASPIAPVTGNTVAFSSAGLLDFATTSNAFTQGIAYTFAAGSPYENDASFAFRLVSVFAPSTSAYAATNSGSTYAGGGTVRFDMVTVSGAAIGSAVPEPSSLALVGAGSLVILAAARRRRPIA